MYVNIFCNKLNPQKQTNGYMINKNKINKRIRNFTSVLTKNTDSKKTKTIKT